MLELLVLLAVRYAGEADGYAIEMLLAARAGHQVSLGTVCRTLQRLQRKRLVRARWGDVRREAGGKRRKLYALTPMGAEAAERRVRGIVRFLRASEIAGFCHPPPDVVTNPIRLSSPPALGSPPQRY